MVVAKRRDGKISITGSCPRPAHSPIPRPSHSRDAILLRLSWRSRDEVIPGKESGMASGVIVQKEIQGDITLITVQGEVDEMSSLQGLFEASTGRIVVDVSGITRINSCGIREWVNAIEKLRQGVELEFIRASRVMVKQFNQVAGFRGKGKVISFFAPYYCEGCDLEENILLSVPHHKEELLRSHGPEFRCENCGDKLLFDDVEERYFSFVHRQENPVLQG
jgi:anti-anti-sigma regulatory factor